MTTHFKLLLLTTNDNYSSCIFVEQISWKIFSVNINSIQLKVITFEMSYLHFDFWFALTPWPNCSSSGKREEENNYCKSNQVEIIVCKIQSEVLYHYKLFSFSIHSLIWSKGEWKIGVFQTGKRRIPCV